MRKKIKDKIKKIWKAMKDWMKKVYSKFKK
jgi:hypothetical protein